VGDTGEIYRKTDGFEYKLIFKFFLKVAGFLMVSFTAMMFRENGGGGDFFFIAAKDFFMTSVYL
jgi:hypothetical protein